LETLKYSIRILASLALMMPCAKIGGGWRLPSKEELNQLFKNKDTIGLKREELEV
jgi:hypothetical protein